MWKKLQTQEGDIIAYLLTQSEKKKTWRTEKTEQGADILNQEVEE